MILTPEAQRAATALLLMIEANADGVQLAKQMNQVSLALGGVDLRSIHPTRVPMYLALLMLVKMLGH